MYFIFLTELYDILVIINFYYYQFFDLKIFKIKSLVIKIIQIVILNINCGLFNNKQY